MLRADLVWNSHRPGMKYRLSVKQGQCGGEFGDLHDGISIMRTPGRQFAKLYRADDRIGSLPATVTLFNVD